MSTLLRCQWCQQVLPLEALTCTACGAATDVRQRVTSSGWVELPAIRDMARLQFGRSFCQIEGTYVPVADFALDASDWVYFNHHVVLWKDPEVVMTTTSWSGGWKRLLAGLPIFMAEARGPGHIAFSMDAPGETIALPLHVGHEVQVREGVFMAATGQVHYDYLNTNFFYRTEEGLHYPCGNFMDRFVAPEEPGLLLLHGAGNVFVRELAPKEFILVKPTALLFKDARVAMTLYIEHPRNYNRVWRRRYVWLKLTGPGRVAIQSAYPHWEDPDAPVTRCSDGAQIIDW